MRAPSSDHRARTKQTGLMTLAPQEGRDELPQGQGRFLNRQHEFTGIVHYIMNCQYDYTCFLF